MNIGELFGIGSALAGIVYGLGSNANKIVTLRKDVDSIARLHRETVEEIHDIAIKVADVHATVSFLRERLK